jgi:NitT/TauT family transport system substrate-binding protein
MQRLPFIRSLAAAALTAGPLRAGAFAQDLPAITLATLINDTATSALYAVNAGLFKKAGVNAQLQLLSSGAAATAAVAGGAAQFGLSSLVNVISAHEKGISLTLVAPAGVITPDVPYSEFVVRSDAPIKSAKDLNGKTIGTPGLKDMDTVAVMNWVDKNGGDSATLKFIEMPGPVALAALQEGRIDGADLNTPTLTRGLESGNVRVLASVLSALAPRLSNTGWFTTEDYAAKNQAIVQKFARVMADAASYCNAHHADTVAMVAQNAKIDEKLVARMARITFGDYLRPAEIQPLIDVAFKYKTIDKAFDAKALISPYALKPPSA